MSINGLFIRAKYQLIVLANNCLLRGVMKQDTHPDPLAGKADPEIFFGLIGPVGANLTLLVDVLAQQLSLVRYRTIAIKVSEGLHQIGVNTALKQISPLKEYERIDKHMDAGSKLRTDTQRGDILALIAVARIRLEREMQRGVTDSAEPRTPLSGAAYVLRSLKHPEEIESLRDIYGSAFHVISAYLPRDRRIDVLSDKLAQRARKSNKRMHRANAEKLVTKDEREEDKYLGQDVSEAFPLADLFVDTSSRQAVEAGVSRYIKSLFAYEFHTPTIDEWAMFQATSAAWRSADLSRQVGASIATRTGEIVAFGWNEVPKAGGGMYGEQDSPDARDFRLGHDTSETFRRRIVEETLSRIFDDMPSLVKNMSSASLEQVFDSIKTRFPGLACAGDPAGLREILCALAEELRDMQFTPGLEMDIKKTMKGARIMGLLEFGRSVHAEMGALSSAARREVTVKGCVLYCTTFPCHLCARHIIAAGVVRVVYIEPYHKSVAQELYDDSIEVDPSTDTVSKVRFEPFIGVAPRAYESVFRAVGERKDERGEVVSWKEEMAVPRFRQLAISYLLLEDRITGDLIPSILQRGIETKWSEPTGTESDEGCWLHAQIEDARKVMKLWPEWVRSMTRFEGRFSRASSRI